MAGVQVARMYIPSFYHRIWEEAEIAAPLIYQIFAGYMVAADWEFFDLLPVDIYDCGLGGAEIRHSSMGMMGREDRAIYFNPEVMKSLERP